ncbi:inverse autotransporter beta domain-containing protein [Thermodesulfobacteriota bacterium]
MHRVREHGRHRSSRQGRVGPIMVLAAIIALMYMAEASAETYPCSPYGNAAPSRHDPAISTDLAPSNPLGPPGKTSVTGGQSDSVVLSNSLLKGIVPSINNLNMRLVYTFGKQTRVRSASVDYFLPYRPNEKNVVYGQAHARFDTFLMAAKGAPDHKVQLLLGGGYRRRIRPSAMLGVNGFYNRIRMTGKWYSSAVMGLEMMYNPYGEAMIDLSLNSYGNPFSGAGGILYAFRKGKQSFKLEAGYTQPLLNRSYYLRMKVSGYKFQRAGTIYGYYFGANLRTASRMFALKYETGRDNFTGTYHNIGGSVSLGFEPEKLLKGENPFTLPR